MRKKNKNILASSSFLSTSERGLNCKENNFYWSIFLSVTHTQTMQHISLAWCSHLPTRYICRLSRMKTKNCVSSFLTICTSCSGISLISFYSFFAISGLMWAFKTVSTVQQWVESSERFAIPHKHESLSLQSSNHKRTVWKCKCVLKSVDFFFSLEFIADILQ